MIRTKEKIENVLVREIDDRERSKEKRAAAEGTVGSKLASVDYEAKEG